MISLDVIVPIYNGAEFIEDFLYGYINALEKIINPINLIIVDNGSSDNTREVFENFAAGSISYSYYVYSEKIGSYAARNYGLQKAQSTWILFTDIDCIFHPEFFSTLFKMELRENEFYGGNVKILVKDKKNPWELLDSKVHIRNESFIFATACLFAKREVFRHVGPFIETISGGDHEWAMRAKSKVFIPVYESNMILYHPPRSDYKSFKKKYLRIASGDALNRLKKSELSYFFGFLKFILKIPMLPQNILKLSGVRFYAYLKFRLLFVKIRFLQIYVYSLVLFSNSSVEKNR